MPDWSKLKPYKTSKEKSFEQLCYQIAVKMFAETGKFTPIDDSGGGDGVEFYLTLENGDEYGWQAKYYENNPRLNQSNRKAGIINSLKRAISVHPKMKRWYLCVPLDFTVEENTWFKNELSKVLNRNTETELIHWGDSFIHERINLPQFNGLRHNFFNDLELNQEWFANTFQNSFSIVKSKFDDLLYVSNNDFEYWYLDPLLCNGAFRGRMNAYQIRLKEMLIECNRSLSELKKLKHHEVLNSPLEKFSEINQGFISCLKQVDNHLSNVFPNAIYKISTGYFSDELSQLSTMIMNAADQTESAIQIWTSSKKRENKPEILLPVREFRKHTNLANELLELIEDFFANAAIPNLTHIANYTGSGGAGKTNLCVAIALRYLRKGFPVIFIPAVKFTGDSPLSSQILSNLDIRVEYNFADFLDTLNTLGNIYNLRVPIILDGLNEAVTHTGGLNPRLAIDILQLEQEISSRTNLILITTCRTSYRKAIWKDTNDFSSKNFVALSGFMYYEDTKRLVQNYFSKYNIQADLSFNSLKPFSKPLYLKIFCETVNSDRKQIKQVTLGHDSIYQIFDRFVEASDSQVFDKLRSYGWPPVNKNRKMVSQTLGKLAELLWTNPARTFELSDMLNIADPNGVTDYERSATKALLEEELLFVRDFDGNSENVYLTYDLMAGYFIGKYLMEVVSDWSGFFRGLNLDKLTSHDYLVRHPHHEDVLKSICTLLPIHKGIFVHSLIGDDKEMEQEPWSKLYSESLNATLNLAPQYITQDEVVFMRTLLTDERNVVPFLLNCEDVLFVVDHPFNFDLFDEILRKLPMNVRDMGWSEHIRDNDGSFLKETVEEFKRLQLLEYHTSEQLQKIDLVSKYLEWNFTCTDSEIQKEASNALYEFGWKYPGRYFDQYYRSLVVNDPMVLEWMTIITYNLALNLARYDAKNSKDLLLTLYHKLEEILFNVNSKYSTSHLIIRDSAFDTLKLIYRKFSKEILITPETIKGRFKNLGIQLWSVSNDKNKGEYRDGNALIHHRFEKEKMYAISGGATEYKQTPTYKQRLANLIWRAYDLGYHFQMFGEADKKIARRHGYGESFTDTKRYADKYIEIAYEEMCGYLSARGMFEDFKEDGYIRAHAPKFAPRFKPMQEVQILSERFIIEDFTEPEMPFKRWCSRLSAPNISQYLRRTEFNDKKGDWILLFGSVDQKKPLVERQIFFYVEALLVPKKNLKTILKQLPLAKKFRPLQTRPFLTNVHDAEIPDSDNIPVNQIRTLQYSIKTKPVLVKYQRDIYERNDVELTDKEFDKIWKDVNKRTGFTKPHREYSGELFNIRIVIKGQEAKEEPEDVLREMRITKRSVFFEKLEEKSVNKNIRALYPVINILNHTYISKNIIDFLGLARINGTTDLFDENGEIASFNHKFGKLYHDEEQFTYLRKDLLDQYLTQNNLEMLYVVTGERDYYPANEDVLSMDSRGRRQFAEIYQVIPYHINVH